MANLSQVKKDTLKKDLEKVKSNKLTEKELDELMAKYEEALKEMEAAKKAAKKTTTKKASTKKEEPKKAEPAKKSTSKKEEPAKKTTTKKADSTAKKTPSAKTTDAPKGRTYTGKYEVFPSGDGYQYRLKASNGETLVVSEVYSSKDSVLKAIQAVQRNVEEGEIRIIKDKHGMFKFKLTSKNYRVLALGSNYSTEKSAVRASESFKRFALTAEVSEIETPQDSDLDAYVLEDVAVEQKTGGKFIVEKFDGEFSWDLKASNGQILCQAEGYTSKSGVMNSIDSFKKNVAEGSFKIVRDKNDNFHYKLYTPAGRVVAVGEAYNTKQAAESAAQSVISYAKDAVVEEV